MIKLLLIFLFCFFGRSISWSQVLAITYLNKEDSTENYFIRMIPYGQIKGAIVLFPGFYQTPEEIIVETDLDELCTKNGYLFVVPIQKRNSLPFEIGSVRFMRDLILEIYKEHQIEDENLIIGGFSSGGSLALLYSEGILSGKITGIKPKAPFMVDSPIDNERVALNELKSSILKNLDIETDRYRNASAYFIYKFKESFGQNYLENSEFYNSSPYVRSDTSLSNIKPLVSLPIRFYSEPDFEYFFDRDSLKFDPNLMNILDGAPLINDLRYLGNTKSELIITKNKGYRRVQNIRHPHSMSIVESQEFLSWVESILDKN